MRKNGRKRLPGKRLLLQTQVREDHLAKAPALHIPTGHGFEWLFAFNLLNLDTKDVPINDPELQR